jgi:hypothetical protein
VEGVSGRFERVGDTFEGRGAAVNGGGDIFERGG